MESLTRIPAVGGSTRLFGIIGNPITQVKTPQLLNTMFEACEMNAVCVPFDIPPATFEAALSGLQALNNVDGLVITVPHKTRAMTMVDEVSENAAQVGAINVMRKMPDGRWFGDLFDGIGLVRGISRMGFDVRGARIKQLGAGGAGAAVAHAMAQAGAASITISEPQYQLSEKLSLQLKEFYPTCAIEIDPTPENVSDIDLLINCSPIGMKASDGMPAPFEVFPKTLQVVDIIMTPPETPLLSHARACGCKVTNGRPMIEGQLEAFATFFGLDMPDSFAYFSEAAETVTQRD